MSVTGVIFQLAITGRLYPARPQLPPLDRRRYQLWTPTTATNMNTQTRFSAHQQPFSTVAIDLSRPWPWLLCHNITPVNVAAEGASNWSALVTSSLPCLFGGRDVMHVSSRRNAEQRERKGERLVPCHVSHAGTKSDQGSTPHGSGGCREIYFAAVFSIFSH